MSDIWTLDEVDDEAYANSPKALRDAYEAAKAKLSDAKKLNEQLTGQVKTLTEKASAQTLDQIIRDKNVPATAAKYLKRDKVEATPEAVDTWLAENGADFGYTKDGQGQQQTETQEQAGASENGADAAAETRIQALGGAAGPQGAAGIEQKISEVAPALVAKGDTDAVVAWLREQGVPLA